MSTQSVGIIPEFQLKDRMRLAREITRLDQSDFAERVGISRATVSNVERGATKPSKLVVRAWALATGVQLRWLETGETPTGSDPDGGGEWAHWGSNPEPTGSLSGLVVPLTMASRPMLLDTDRRAA